MASVKGKGSKMGKARLGPFKFPCGTAEYKKEENLRRRYNMTLVEYDRLLAAQNGVCAICGEAPEGMALCVDHDHDCCPGKTSCGQCVRGILCTDCNHGLGKFKDDVARMAGGILYLNRFQ